MVGLTAEFALFTQTTSGMKNSTFFEKLLTSEFWATLEWMFVIPMQRIGYTFFNPAQLAVSSYVWNFISQIWANKFWLKLPTTVDDYTAMVIILFGMYAAKFTVFG
jgi:uncharacterized protein (DUF486 family)